MAEINKLVVPISDGQGGYTPTEITFEGSGGGSGLPDEVITYQQFRAKSDSDQAAYTGYVSDWPGITGDSNIRYNDATDWLQVKVNNNWVNAIYIGAQLDPTKMQLTQDEFIAICNLGLQSRMSLGAIITLNNQYGTQYEVIGTNHDDTINTVDIMAHTYVGKMYFDTGSQTNSYSASTLRAWINSTFLESFDYDIRRLMKTMTVTQKGVTNTDKAKLLNWKELGVNSFSYADSNENGVPYPVFTSGAYNSTISDRARSEGQYTSGYHFYWTRSNYTGNQTHVHVIEQSGKLDWYTPDYLSGVLPVMRF